MKYKTSSKTLFIVSSSEFPIYRLQFKDSLNTMLKRLSLDYIECLSWRDDGVFKQGYGFLDTLVNLPPDYVVALVTPDDTAVIKGKEYIIPRDNVVFEYGLFLGKLGRDKTFFVTPRNTPDLQIMSDLNGVSTVRYRFSPNAGPDQAKEDLLEAVSAISVYIYQMERLDMESQEVTDLKPANPIIPPKTKIFFP